MRHNINVIASNEGLNKEDFRNFCNHPVVMMSFALENEEGFITVSTSSSIDLVKAFLRKLDMGISERLTLSHLLQEHKQKLTGILYCRERIASDETEQWEKKEYKAVQEYNISRVFEIESHVRNVWGVSVKQAVFLL